MSYGIQVKNDTGDFVLDSTGVMYLVDQGTCKFSPTVSSPRATIPYFNGIMINPNGLNQAPTPYFYQSGYKTWPSTYSQCIANYFITYQAKLTSSLPHIANRTYPDFPLSETAIAFVQIPSQGIIQMGHVTNILPEFNSGATFVVQSVNSGLVNYKVFDKTLPAVSGTYGMKVFNSAGETVFDSRPEILGVQDFFNITAAQFQSVITQNVVIYLTLKKPTPNAYISSPTWANFTAESNRSPNSRGFAKIRQINDTTLSISMQRYGRALSDYRYNRSHFADCQLLVARST